jgi:hypothetical protein
MRAVGGRNVVKTIILLIVLVASATPVLADDCDGLLRRNGDGLLLLAPRGNEREGACVIAKTDEPRVLRTCKIGERRQRIRDEVDHFQVKVAFIRGIPLHSRDNAH